MSSSHLQLKVVEVTRETPDAITIYFEHPDRKNIPYKAGQFLTLIIPVNGKKERRSYSLSSAPYEAPRLAVTVKRLTNGLISSYLVDTCKAGMEMEVLEPMGNFNVITDPGNSRNIILIGAGSGITPLIAMAKAVLHDEPKSRVTLIYGNRHANSVIFKEKLNDLQTQYHGRLVVEHVFSQPKGINNNTKLTGLQKLTSIFSKKKAPEPEPTEVQYKHVGRLNRKMLIEILQELKLTDFLDTEYYLCGPEGLTTEAKEALKILKVAPEQIRKENFVASQEKKEMPDATVSADTDDDEAGNQVVTLLYEGTEYKFEVPQGQTILEAGLSQDIDLPYSCQAGLCTACRGKCLSGKVHLDEREGLSDAEIAEGYVLNCVAHPLTKDVIIEIG